MALKLGSKGKAVEDLQRQLYSQGLLADNILLPTKLGKIDGHFGKVTQDAVIWLQRAFNLKDDGIVNAATAGAIKKNGQITKHFNIRHFKCKGSGLVRVRYKLVAILQKVREDVGALQINSGYRCPWYNRKVGGASESYHMKAQAADVVPLANTKTKLVASAKKHGAGGIGTYSTFVHIDIGPKRTWKG